MLIKIGEKFGPDKALLSLYYIYLGVPTAFIFVGITLVNLFLFIVGEGWLAWIVSAPLYGVLLAVVLPTLIWIPMYFHSIAFTLEDDRILFERGVWWKRASYIPYNRITNLDTIQGPLSRAFGLGKVTIQTAGYSATAGSASAMYAEAAIFGVKNFEEIKDTILSIIGKYRPVAVEAASEAPAESLNAQILSELRKIRESLERK